MKRSSLFLLSITTVIVLAACGFQNEKDKNVSTLETSHPKTEKTVLTIKDMAERHVNFEKEPKRVLPLTLSDLNIIYALGGKAIGRQTMDKKTIYPQTAAGLPEVGDTHNLNIEKMASLRPDVIVASSEQNIKDVPVLEGTGAKVVLTGANSIKEIKQQIDTLGKLIQKEQKAKELNNKLSEKEKQIMSAQKNKQVRALLVLGAPGSNYAALPTSLSGDLLEKAGGINVAKEFKGVKNFPQYASLNVEKIVASDPQIIFLMIHGGDVKETEMAFKKELRENDAWNSTTAVKENHVVVLPPNLFGTNPGVRVSESLEYMAREINRVNMK